MVKRGFIPRPLWQRVYREYAGQHKEIVKPKGRFGPASQGWVKAFSFQGHCPHPSDHNPIAKHFTDMKNSVNAMSFKPP